MKKQKQISREEAQRIGEALHIDWNQIDLEQFRQGILDLFRGVGEAGGN